MKSIKILSLALVSCIVAVSCLKDKAYDDGEIQSVRAGDNVIKPIEIKLTATDVTNFKVIAVDNSLGDTTINLVPINLATNAPAATDIHVTITVDEGVLQHNNDTTGREDSLLPTTIYSLINPVVTIPKGSNTGYLQIKFTPSALLEKSYALGLRITKVEEAGYTISGNAGTAVAALFIKNKYDGIYTVTGYHIRGGDPSLTGPIGTIERALVTQSLNSVAWEGAVPWGGPSQLPGGYEPIITVDDETNKVTNITSANGASTMDETYDNHYDPATRTFYIKWKYPSGAVRSFTDTLVFKEKRP